MYSFLSPFSMFLSFSIDYKESFPLKKTLSKTVCILPWVWTKNPMMACMGRKESLFSTIPPPRFLQERGWDVEFWSFFLLLYTKGKAEIGTRAIVKKKQHSRLSNNLTPFHKFMYFSVILQLFHYASQIYIAAQNLWMTLVMCAHKIVLKGSAS